jgi:O-methyltransferase involved in polyketide biosynthesis
METMKMIAACAKGSEVVFSFSVPDEHLGDAELASRRRSMQRMAQAGEPWITFYDPPVLERRLRELGFSRTVLLSPAEANRRYFADRRDGLRIGSGYMMSAHV